MRRLPSIDILRVITVALIVYRHTYGAEAAPMIASVGVPFFFFLTGWLWKPGKRSIGEEARHRWHTLGIPYIAWLVILYPLYLFGFWFQDKLTLERAIAPLLGGSYVGAPYSTFWFISALLLAGILMRLLDRAGTLVLLSAAMALLAVGGMFGAMLAVVPLGLGVAVPSVSFLLLGRIFRTMTGTRWRPVALVAIPVVSVATIPLAPIDIKIGNFGTFMASGLLAVMLTWAVIVSLDWALSKLPTVAGTLSRYLSPITSVAIIVVLTHPAVLWILRFAVPAENPPPWVPLVALFVPWAAAVLIARTRLAPFLIGREPQKATVATR